METTLPDKFSLGFQFLKDAALSAINSVTEATEQFKESPAGISLNNWLELHPVMLWIVSHPLISLAIAIVGIVLLLGLLKAAIKLVEKMYSFKVPESLKTLGMVPIQIVFHHKQHLTLSLMVMVSDLLIIMKMLG